MLKFILNIFARAEKSVASITADLQRTVADLEAHAADRLNKALAEEQKIAAAAKARGEHLEEQLKATTIAQKIGALLS